MRVISVVGARPQFVKLAPMARAFDAASVEHNVIHTGQHYDANMSDAFFDGFGLAAPDWNLAVGSGSHGAQTAEILARIEPVLIAERPDWVLVYGDTNSTIAAALAAVKLGIPLAHLEAGLRSFNRSMPEEHNRVLTDHCADLLLAPTDTAAHHLEREGLSERTRVVGDVMVDVLLDVDRNVRDTSLPASFPTEDFVLATIHRPFNTDDPDRLRSLLDQLARFDCPVVLPAHPRLTAAADRADLVLERGAIKVIEPLAYHQLVHVLGRSRAVVTDSGGLQKEAYVLGRTTTTVRTETEWTETLDQGWNVLVENLGDLETLALRPPPTTDRGQPYGDGAAAHRSVAEMRSWAFR